MFSKKPRATDSSGGFAIDDGTSPVISATGRKRTTLKMKLTKVDEDSKCILPGVTIMGGGRDAASSSRSQRGTGGTDNSGQEPHSQPSPMLQQQLQQAAMASNFQNNEALMRAFGNGGVAPWQALPNGSYQFANPMAQQFGGAPGNGFFPMAAGPYGMMNPFANGSGVLPRGMDNPHFDQNMSPQEMEFRLRQQKHQQAGFAGASGTGMQPFHVPSQSDFRNSDGHDPRQQNAMNPHFFASGGNTMQHQGVNMTGQGGSFWGAQASQQMQPGSALMGGIDERNLPPHLASMAMARRMNNQNARSMGPGDMMHGMQNQNARRADPPPDPP